MHPTAQDALFQEQMTKDDAKEQEVMVSVLMLTYNHQDFVRRALDSVLGQKTDFTFEIVVSDDASLDQTQDILLGYKDRFKERICLLLSKENQGLIPNFLKAYKACRGKYIAICEGDDFWISKNKLQKQVSYLESHPECSLTFHRAVNLYQNCGTKSLSNPHQETESSILDLSQSNFITNVTAVFRHEPTLCLPEWFAKVSTYDYALHMLTAVKGSIHYFKDPMAVYRKREGAIWSLAGKNKQWEIALTVREVLMNHFMDSDKEVFQNLRDAHLIIGTQYVSYLEEKGQKEEAENMKTRILKYWSEDNWDTLQAQHTDLCSSARRSIIKKSLSMARGLISWFIPLPRISA